MSNDQSATATPALAQAWASYHRALEEIRAAVEATPRFQGYPEQRAMAYYALMEVQAFAYNFAMAPRMLHPRIFRNCGWATDMYSLAQNCPDFIYGVLFLDGQQTYRLSGRIGELSMLSLQTDDGFPSMEVKITGNYDLKDMAKSDGTFDVILSATEQPANWIRIVPESGYQFLFFRRCLQNWHGDPGELRVERISDISDHHYDADEFDEAAMAIRIGRAETCARYLANLGIIGLYDMYYEKAGKQKNIMKPQHVGSLGGVASPYSDYAMCAYELADDEALVVELDKIPDGAYWSFSLSDVWSRTLNFLNRHTSINDYQAVVDADGKFRAVLSRQDPGVANWLDTCGFNEGTVVFRNYRASTPIVPALRKVKFNEIHSLLPADTKRVTLAERKQAIEHRRQGQLKIYGE